MRGRYETWVSNAWDAWFQWQPWIIALLLIALSLLFWTVLAKRGAVDLAAQIETQGAVSARHFCDYPFSAAITKIINRPPVNGL